jgi:hypothetical protein
MREVKGLGVTRSKACLGSLCSWAGLVYHAVCVKQALQKLDLGKETSGYWMASFKQCITIAGRASGSATSSNTTMRVAVCIHSFILEHRYRQGRHPAAAYRVPWLFLSPCMMLACLPRNRFRRELGELRFKIHFSEVRRSCTPTSHLLYMARILDSAFPREDTERGETALSMSNKLFTCRSSSLSCVQCDR